MATAIEACARCGRTDARLTLTSRGQWGTGEPPSRLARGNARRYACPRTGATMVPVTGRAENPRVGNSILPLAIVNDMATTGGTEEGGAHARQCIRTVRRRRRGDPAAGARDHILGPWP